MRACFVPHLMQLQSVQKPQQAVQSNQQRNANITPPPSHKQTATPSKTFLPSRQVKPSSIQDVDAMLLLSIIYNGE